MQVLIFLSLFLVACSSRVSQVRAGIEQDRWAFTGEPKESAEATRRKALRIALERLKERKVSPKTMPQIVKLKPKKTPVEETETVADSSDEWMHHYYRGLSFIAENQHDKATAEFRKFLETEPNHVYADRALYWIVESYYRNREYGLCVVSANDFILHFSYSVKRPEVLFRRALAFKAMGDNFSAKETLKELLRQHPQTTVAESARSRLAQWFAGGSG